MTPGQRRREYRRVLKRLADELDRNRRLQVEHVQLEIQHEVIMVPTDCSDQLHQCDTGFSTIELRVRVFDPKRRA